MPIETKPTEAALADLAKEYAKLIGKTDRASGFRRRMLRGRAQSIIRKTVKGARAQDAALADWDKQARSVGIEPEATPAKICSPMFTFGRKATSKDKGGKALID